MVPSTYVFVFALLSGDNIGRKRAMLTGIAIVLPSMFLGGFVGHYVPYILLRFISCTAIVFCWVAAHNLVVGSRAKNICMVVKQD